MDELLHHCLRELSFDGDLGCNVSRLGDFVAGFYDPAKGLPQNPDPTFCSFVWSLVVQHPTVVVGLLPQGVTSEVWVAPQTSAKRKAKASGQDHVQTEPAKLEIIPDAKTIPMHELVQRYGESLRIAVEPAAIFAAITGTHIRSSRMSPMVYTALQIITRGRDDGVTVVQLGQQSKYDQKTCFYLVKQLTEMDLVAKVRRGGVGTHFCIHKYFYDRSPSWQAIRDEETRAEEAAQASVDPQGDPSNMQENDAPFLHFTPIDSRHLSSLPLVKARVVKLLRASHSHIHAANNLLLTLGFSNPTKTDRRFFHSRIRELLQQGVIEKVLVPSNRKGSNTGSTVKCFRLVSEAGDQNTAEDGVIVQADDEKDDEKEDDITDESGVKANITIHKQIIDVLEDSGTTGMTLNELSTALGNFDKRTIELFLARADKSPPPPHLADLGIAGLMETSGRERRHRYYTVAAYQKLIAAEQLDKSSAGFESVDTSQTGGYGTHVDSLFYNEVAELIRFEDTFHRANGKSTKRLYKNPILADGSVKKGRPRKQPVAEENGEGPAKKTKRKRGTADADGETPEPKKRGRPKKVQVVEEVAEDAEPSVPSAPKKRGRASKRKMSSTEDGDPPVKAKRLRASKGTPAEEEEQRDSTQTPGEPATAHAPGEAAREVQAPNGSAAAQEIPPSESPAVPQETIADQEDAVPTAIVFEQPEAMDVSPQPVQPCPPPPEASASAVETPPSLQPPAAKGPRTRVNVSHLRRENELLRILEEAGGIMNIQTKEFFDAHTALLETLAKAGEPTSAPVGTRTDKRTAALTIEGLETKGKVKQLKTSITTHTGVSKPANIVYLPSVTQEHLNSFLAEVSRGTLPTISSAASTVKIQEPVPYGADSSITSRGVLPLQLLQLEQPGDNKKERWSKNATRANQLFTYDDATIRDVLLAERTTQGQLYGYIVGKAARARSFHLSTLEALLSPSQSPNVLPGSRIVDLAYFNNDLPVCLFTTFASVLSPSEQLTRLYSSDEGRNTPVKDLPPELHTLLQVGRSRARTRILDLLDLLQSLKLVTPLKPSTSAQPWVTAIPHGHHPTAFDIATDEGWSSSTPHAAPSYWYFNTEAPLFLWSLSDTEPPYWKTAPTDTVQHAQEYWQFLRDASIDLYFPRTIETHQPADGAVPVVSAARTLRRPASWNADYVLTWHQQKFLEKSVDLASGDTALEEADPTARAEKVARLCWVTSAPQKAVENYLRVIRIRVTNDKMKLRDQGKEMRRLKKLEDTKIALAKKAEEAKVTRENQWISLLANVHPGDLGAAASRVERVHLRFVQAGTVRDLGKWEKELLDAIRESNMASTKMIKFPGKRSIVPRPAPGPSTVPVTFFSSEAPSSTVMSIKALIDQQQPLLDQGLFKRKPKNKKKGKDPEPVSDEKKGTRRQRFQWNKEYDELARDASVIIRARCRAHSRLDWTALEQVFPAVPRNTVRQRLSSIRESPGSESYLRRLEDRWFGLWEKFRGTQALPDEHPESPFNFNLIQHIEFLRHNVDKNALRVGFGQEKEVVTTIIPCDVDNLLLHYDVVEEAPSSSWDFVWNSVVEEGREKRLLSQCFTAQFDSIPSATFEMSDEDVLAETALKMTMGSPPETYNCDNASTLLRSVGEAAVSKATQRMLGKGLLSKLQRDLTKQRPGRQLKISDSNSNAMGGIIPRDTYNDAVALLENAQCAEDVWRDWPLTATDGDMVGLIHLVSEGQVEFRVDTSDAQAARPSLDWNSKRADDDQIETAISVKYERALPSTSEIEMEWISPIPGDDEADIAMTDVQHPDGHGLTESKQIASCQRTSKAEYAIIDCSRCLQETRVALEESMTSEEREVAEQVLQMLSHAGPSGCQKHQLKAILHVDQSLLPDILHRLTDANVPLIHWVGYTELRLVAAEHITKWTVVVSETPFSRVIPRRWLSIGGRKIRDYWQAALRAVMGLVILRPGVSQAEIRWRLRSVYDRQELNEVLSYLHTERYLSMRRDRDSKDTWIDSLPDNAEELELFWFLGDRCWFQV